MADHDEMVKCYIEMVKRSNFHIRDYVAAIHSRDPKKCWPFQSLIDYDDFQHLPESTNEPSKAKRKQKRKGKVAVSENPIASRVEENGNGEEIISKDPAVNGSNINNNLTLDDVEDDFENVTLGEFLRKQRALKAIKNKKKQNAVEVEEPRLSVAKPLPAGSSSLLGGLKPPGSVPRMREPVMEAGVARVQAPEMALARPWDCESFGCSINMNPAEFSTQIAKKFMRRVLG